VEEPDALEESAREHTDLVDWSLSLLVASAMALIAYRFGIISGLTRWSIRWSLSASLGSLLTYSYVAANFSGANVVLAAGRGVLVWLVLFGGLVGWGVGFLWRWVQTGNVPNDDSDTSDFAKTRSG
jgi:hypothetical protein